MSLGGRGREIEFLSLSKREERDLKDGAAGEEMKRSEQRRETTGVQRKGGEEQECGKINACKIKESRQEDKNFLVVRVTE